MKLLHLTLTLLPSTSYALCGVNVLNVDKGNVVVGSGCVPEGGEATICYTAGKSGACIPVKASDVCGLDIGPDRVLPPYLSLQKSSSGNC